MGSDGVVDVGRQRLDMRPRQIGIHVVERKRALFFCELNARTISGMADGGQPLADQFQAARRTIADLAEDQRVGQARDAQPDAALGLGFGILRIQRKARHVDGIVHHPHGAGDQPFQLRHVQRGSVFERVAHQLGQVDRPQQAGAIRRQGLFAAGIGGGDAFAIAQIVGVVDAVDEDHARLGVIIGRAHHALPQGFRLDGAIHLAAELQVPVGIGLHRRHEGITDQNRQVEIGQPPRRALGGDEILDIGMIDAQRRHHRAAPRSGAHDGAAHRVPHIHERHGARGVRPHALHQRALGPQGGKVVADAAALLERQRRFAQGAENSLHGIFDRAHHKTVEQRDGAARAGARQNPSRRKEFVTRQRLGEFARARGALFGRFGLGQRQRHAGPAFRHVAVQRGAIRRFQPVFQVPDLRGNIAHGCPVKIISGAGAPPY